MEAALLFREVLEAIDALPLEEQEEVVAVAQRRIIEQRRREVVVREIAEAEAEFEAGGSEERSPDELMQEILS